LGSVLKVKRKIVALIVAMAALVLPFSQRACVHGTCRPHHSSPLPCHELHGHESTDSVEAARNPTCCRLLPLVPTVPRDRMMVKTIQQVVPASHLNGSSVLTAAEYRDRRDFGDSPPQIERQSLLSVLQI